MNGIVLSTDSKPLREAASRRGLAVTVAAEPCLPHERTLIVGPGVEVPWHLVGFGFAFLERWEAAAPLAGVLTSEIGGKAEQGRTQAVVRDLRVPVYASGLLFVRRCSAGEALLAAWRAESTAGADTRLAFLRALYQVKPVMLALPRTWMQGQAATPEPQRQASSNPLTRLIHVEIAPGLSVCCRPDEAEMYRQRFAAARAKRRV